MNRTSGGVFASYILVAACILIYVYAFRPIFIDDAFIQFQYARTLADSGTWGLYPDRMANTATSPLNVLLLALPALASLPMIETVVWLTAVELFGLFVCLVLISRRLYGGPWLGVIGLAGVAANPLIVSTIGLESILYILFFVIAVACYLGQRWRWLAVVLGLLTLTRPDGGVLFVLMVLLMPASLRERFRLVVYYVLVLAPWFAYSWVYLGSLLPDTFLIKVSQASWEGYTFRDGLALYLTRYPVATVASFVLLPFAPLASLLGSGPVRRVAALIGLYAATHFAAYAILNVPPYHWYYLHLIMPIALLGALGMTNLVYRWSRWHPLIVPGGACAAFLLPVGTLGGVLLSQGVPPLTQPPIHSNWATQARYEEIGMSLRDQIGPTETIELRGEIGMLAFYSERLLINEFSDMGRVNQFIGERGNTSHTVLRTLLALNFAWRRPISPLPRPRYLLEQVVFAEGQPPPGPEDVIQAWDTSTRWVGSGRVYLRRLEVAP
jgi:hypothetical protein